MKKRLSALLLVVIFTFGLGSVLAAEHVASPVGKDQIIMVDGKLDDWQVGEKTPVAIVLNDRAQAVRGESAWQGSEDSSGEIYLKWTKDYLLVAADVVDDVAALGGKIDNGDSIAVTIIVDGTASLLTEMTPYPPEGKWSEATLFRESGVWIVFPSTAVVRASNKADGKGYYLEAAIPWADLHLRGKQVDPLSGSPVLFNVLITDADSSSSRKSVLQNTRDAGNPVSSWYSDPKAFMPLVLSGDGAGAVKW